MACAFGSQTFFYRYTSPVTNKLSQVKTGSFPQISLATAFEESQKPKAVGLMMEGLVELYLAVRTEDRISADRIIIPGALTKKGQKEGRRTLDNDAVAKPGTHVAAEIIRNAIVGSH